MRHLPLHSVSWALLFALFTLPALPAAAYDLNAPRVEVPYKTLCAAILAARAAIMPMPLPADFRTGNADAGVDAATARDAIIAAWNPSKSLAAIATIEVFDGVSRTLGFSVEVVPSNGLRIAGQDAYNGANTFYKITSPEGWHAISIKVNTRSSGVAVYQPYNLAYHTPENLANGWQYLTDVFEEAERRLDENGVTSAHADGLLITKAVRRDVLFSLILDEHMDKDEVRERGAVWAAEKVLVLLALNRENTYYYAISSAAAAGLAQFIKRSYNGTRGRCPTAKLTEDFLSGMRDHLNAVMAQYCYADDTIAKLLHKRLRIPKSPPLLGAYLAAAYNAGPGAAIPAYRNHTYFCKRARHKREWCHKPHGLPSETITYVSKFADVYRLVIKMNDSTTVITKHKSR